MNQPFCKHTAHDSKGTFCIVAALEGHNCSCSYSAEDCHVVKSFRGLRIQCGGEKLGIVTFTGVCQDFEPTTWLEQSLLGKNDYSI